MLGPLPGPDDSRIRATGEKNPVPIEVQPSSATGSASSDVGEQVRQVGHDLRNLLTIFIGVTESLEGLPQKDAPVEDGLAVLRTLSLRLQGLAEDLRDIGRQADQLPACDAAALARDLTALEPSLGPLARAYRSAPLLRARDGDVVRLWTVVTLGAQRLGDSVPSPSARWSPAREADTRASFRRPSPARPCLPSCATTSRKPPSPSARRSPSPPTTPRSPSASPSHSRDRVSVVAFLLHETHTTVMPALRRPRSGSRYWPQAARISWVSGSKIS